jgi:hypothetical protein
MQWLAFYEQGNFANPSTFYKAAGPTFFAPNGGASTLDQIIIPTSALQNITSLSVAWLAGRRLQLIPHQQRRDHYPLVLTFRYSFKQVISKKEQIDRWDQDKISSCLSKGSNRIDFLQDLEKAIVDITPELEELSEATNVDHHWKFFADTVRKVALTHFRMTGKAKYKDDDYEQRATERRELLKTMGDLREKMATDPDPDSFGSVYDDIKIKLNIIQAKMKKAKRSFLEKRQQRIEAEIEEAMRRQREHEVQRLSRLIAGTKLGIRKRKYGLLPSLTPSAEDLYKMASAPGCEGGLGAVKVDLEDEIKKWTDPDNCEPLAPADLNATRAASWDLRRTIKSMIYSNKRKACPVWGVPAEVWLFSLDPLYISKRIDDKTGVGATTLLNTNDSFLSISSQAEKCLQHCHRASLVPIVANISQAFWISKLNGKKGLGGLRLLHCYDSFWRHFFAGALSANQRSLKPTWPDWCHAYLRKRRREAPMMILRITAQRLIKSQMPFLVSFRDQTNAFASTLDPVRDEVMHELIAEGGEHAKGHRPFFHQRIHNSVVLLPCEDTEEKQTYIPQQGNVIGGPEGPKFFSRAFNRTIEAWWDRTRCLGPQLHFKHPITKELQEAGLVVFADDIAAVRAIPDGLATTAAELLINDTITLDRGLGEGGWKQNVTKMETVPNLRKLGQNSLLAKKVSDRWLEIAPGSASADTVCGRFLPCARHLGGLLSWNGNNSAELQLRLRSMTNSWLEMGFFWTSRIPWKLKRTMLIGRIVSSAISGLLSYAMLPSQYATLDVKLCKYIRVLMAGTGHRVDEAGKHSSDSRIEVLKTWRQLPLQFEDSVRRLSWLKEMVAFPSDHKQITAAIFGTFELYNNTDPQRSKDLKLNILDTDGHIVASAPGAEFAMAFQAAIECYRDISGTEDFFETWEESGCSWTTLLGASEVGGDDLLLHYLSNLDPSLLRSAFFTGNLALQYRMTIPSEADEHHECLLCTSGKICSQVFSTKQALVRHQMQQHKVIHPFLATIVTNQCPACRTILASIKATRQHLEQAYLKGYCLANRAHQHWELKTISNLSCQFCDFQAQTTVQLVEHCSSHLPLPSPITVKDAWSSRSGSILNWPGCSNPKENHSSSSRRRRRGVGSRGGQQGRQEDKGPGPGQRPQEACHAHAESHLEGLTEQPRYRERGIRQPAGLSRVCSGNCSQGPGCCLLQGHPEEEGAWTRPPTHLGVRGSPQGPGRSRDCEERDRRGCDAEDFRGVQCHGNRSQVRVDPVFSCIQVSPGEPSTYDNGCQPLPSRSFVEECDHQSTDLSRWHRQLDSQVRKGAPFASRARIAELAGSSGLASPTTDSPLPQISCRAAGSSNDPILPPFVPEGSGPDQHFSREPEGNNLDKQFSPEPEGNNLDKHVDAEAAFNTKNMPKQAMITRNLIETFGPALKSVLQSVYVQKHLLASASKDEQELPLPDPNPKNNNKEKSGAKTANNKGKKGGCRGELLPRHDKTAKAKIAIVKPKNCKF